MNRGGSYIKDKNGSVKKQEGTQDHPSGNRPRDAQGKPLNVPQPEPVADIAKPAAADDKQAKRGDK